MNLVQLKSMPTADDEQDWATFETFWELYPRKVARLDARKAWSRLSSVQAAATITALVKWREVWMIRGELEFVPHASTWLHGERWEDELPTGYIAASTALRSSHLPAILPQQTERTAMPDSVRAAFAKLRGKA